MKKALRAAPIERELKFIGSSRDDLSAMPPAVKEVLGHALYLAQIGDKHEDAKPLKGDAFKGTSVMEIVEDFKGDTYRGVYTARIGTYVCVLHAFQKKSKRGSETPKKEIDLIKARLKTANDLYGKNEKGK